MSWSTFAIVDQLLPIVFPSLTYAKDPREATAPVSGLCM